MLPGCREALGRRLTSRHHGLRERRRLRAVDDGRMTRGHFEQRWLGSDDERNSEAHRFDGRQSEPLEVGWEDHETRRSELLLEGLL
jgi:hypothetical protein